MTYIVQLLIFLIEFSKENPERVRFPCGLHWINSLDCLRVCVDDLKKIGLFISNYMKVVFFCVKCIYCDLCTVPVIRKIFKTHLSWISVIQFYPLVPLMNIMGVLSQEYTVQQEGSPGNELFKPGKS